MPFPHYTGKNSENAIITGNFGFMCEENLEMKIMRLSWSLVSKCSIFKKFYVNTKTHSRHFQVPPVEEHFGKALFLWWISVDSRLSQRNKAKFLSFSRAVWIEPKRFIDGARYIYFMELPVDHNFVRKRRKSVLINGIHNQRRNVLRMSDTKMKTGSLFLV